MSDPIRCSSCDAIVDRVFVHGERLRASCPRCAFQFDVRCSGCREPLAATGSCPRCASGPVSSPPDDPGEPPESPPPDDDGLVVQIQVEPVAATTYRGGPEPGTMTVSVEDRALQERWSTYLADCAAFERDRAQRARSWSGPSLLELFVDPSPPVPQRPVPRGGAARISRAGIEVRDDRGRWRPPIDPGQVFRVQVEPEGPGFVVRVETMRNGGLTLLAGLPLTTAKEIAEQVEAHLAKLSEG